MRHATHNGHTAFPITADFEALKGQLADWRQSHKAPARIPEDLWSKAVELAGRYGIGCTARTLRLDYASLRRRVQPPGESKSSTFLEWLTPTSGVISECTIEVEARNGSSLRLQAKNLAVAGLAQIIQQFVA
jgi:hypothetical protein